MTTMEKIYNSGIVPVVVIEDANNAIDTAKALLAGGIEVMEITFRTAAAKDAIKLVAENVKDMCVGAGTVINAEQAKQAVEAGAKFIVSPGFDEETVKWCIENNIPVTPGCVTPTEIMAAKKLGLKTLKFFPAGVYGGLKAMKALSAPFGDVTFIPTGGVNADNLSEYASAPFVYAIGGSWVCDKKDIVARNFDKITSLSKQAREILLGFEVAHVGINSEDESACNKACDSLSSAFNFETKVGNSSNFTSSMIEVMKAPFLGKNGHIAIRTNRIDLAVNELKKKGFEVDPSTAKYKNDKLNVVYLKDEFGGFAVHLIQK